jgi:Tol biopolymer transport system component
LVFWFTRDGGFNLYWKAADGSGKVEPLLVKEQDAFASSWTPDGKTLAFYGQSLDSRSDIWVFPLNGEPSALIHDPFDKRLPMISPDGRWLAYVSNESGRDGIYVQPFPELGKRWQISNERGNEPVWAKNGRELFYRNGRKMMSVSIQTEPEFQPGTPHVLFEEEYEVDNYSDQSYDVTPDGQRFVMIQSQEQDMPIHVVLNWLEEVKRKMQERN